MKAIADILDSNKTYRSAESGYKGETYQPLDILLNGQLKTDEAKNLIDEIQHHRIPTESWAKKYYIFNYYSSYIRKINNLNFGIFLGMTIIHKNILACE